MNHDHRYAYVTRGGQDAIALEPKEEMKKRGLASPDRADAFALTFAFLVALTRHSGGVPADRCGPLMTSDYDPLEMVWTTADYLGHLWPARVPGQGPAVHRQSCGCRQGSEDSQFRCSDVRESQQSRRPMAHEYLPLQAGRHDPKLG